MAVDLKTPKPGIEAASLTDVGRQRSNNEDSYRYWEHDSDEDFRRKGRLAVVADGMGGYVGGQEASHLAVETVRSIYDNTSGGDPQAALLEAFESAHQNIQRYALEHPQFYGMGTTCTALSIVNRQLCFAHVGDSRLYLIRGETISRLTRDHSYVGRLVETGIVRSEDAESHPQRHILTAALGSGRDVYLTSPSTRLRWKIATLSCSALTACGVWSATRTSPGSCAPILLPTPVKSSSIWRWNVVVPTTSRLSFSAFLPNQF